MAYFNLDGLLVASHNGQPIKRGSIKVENIATLASETAQERLLALNFDRLDLNAHTRFYRHIRLPGSSPHGDKIKGSKSKASLLLLPHLPAYDGLWSVDLCATANLEFCTVLPHIEQQLMLSTAPIFMITPHVTVSLQNNLVEALEGYQRQLAAMWNEIKSQVESLDVLAFGAGGAALVLAMSVDPHLSSRVHKISFVECDDLVAKALNMTSKADENGRDDLYRTSPILKILEQRAIMFKLDAMPMGKVIKDEKESGCGCPVVSIGTTNKDHAALEGAALGLAYFRRKDVVGIPKWLVTGIALVFLSLFALILLLSWR